MELSVSLPVIQERQSIVALIAGHAALLALVAMLTALIAACASNQPSTVSIGAPHPFQESISASSRGNCRPDAMKICRSFLPAGSSDATSKTVSFAIPNGIAPLAVRCEYAGKGGPLTAAELTTPRTLNEDEEAFLQGYTLCADPQAR